MDASTNLLGADMQLLNDLPDDVRAIAEKSIELRTQNAARIDRLERMGFPLEIVMARVEHFMDKLVDAGILTDAQVHAWNLEWEENLGKQIERAEEKAGRMMAEMQKQARKQARAAAQKLTTPAPKSLLLPGGRVHVPQPGETEEKPDEESSDG